MLVWSQELCMCKMFDRCVLRAYFLVGLTYERGGNACQKNNLDQTPEGDQCECGSNMFDPLK